MSSQICKTEDDLSFS